MSHSKILQAHHQHANVRADLFLDIPVFDNPATRFCAALAKQVDGCEWALLRPAIYCAMMLVAGCLRRDDNGIRLPDRAQPGQAFVVFATGDREGCSCGGIAAIDEVDAAREAAVFTTSRERRERLLALTKSANARQAHAGDAYSRALAIECAGLLVDLDMIDALEAVEGALPVLVILTKRERDRRAVRSRILITTLPGAWLGTSAPAGHA